MKIIQLELNEISKEIVDAMIAKGKLKHFDWINQQYQYARTFSDARYENIEPWIQWVSAHTGKTYQEHQIFHLSDVEKLSFPQVWETLYQGGVRSAIIGSMNTKQGSMKEGIFFPDPWAKNGKAYPDDLQALWQLVAAKVQSHATSRLTLSDLMQGVKCCFKYRIPFSLYLKIMKQLISQTFDTKKKWRMPALFDELLSHIFLTIFKTTNFGFYTLFLNSCAHYQHHYWREFDRKGFDPSLQSPDIASDDDPISFGYEMFDSILGRILNLVKQDKNTRLIISSAFTQEPYLKAEEQGGMNYYRLKDHQAFVNTLNFSYRDVHPLMSRDWQITFNTIKELDYAKTRLSELTVLGKPLFNLKINSENSLFIETKVTQALNNDAMIMDGVTTLGPFHQYFKNIAIKSGHHNPYGSLWLSERIPGFTMKDGMSLTELYRLPLIAFDLIPQDEEVGVRLPA